MLAHVANHNGSFISHSPTNSGAFGSPGENEWVLSAMNGDLSAFNQLVIAHQDGLYRWVLSLVDYEDIAEDITQTTFITAYEKLDTFRGGSFRARLYTIARNRSFDELRRQKRLSPLRLDAASGEEQDMLETLPGRDPLPEDELVDAELGEKIERLLARLPADSQQVLRLVDMEAMDYQEAAEILRVPLGTVKSRLTRARLKMRQLVNLEEDHYK